MKKYLWMTFILGSLGILFLTIKHFLPYTTQNQIESVLLPGWQSADLEHLDPKFRKKVRHFFSFAENEVAGTWLLRGFWRALHGPMC